MPQTSGVLIVDPHPSKTFDFGATVVPDVPAAYEYLTTAQPSIVVFGYGLEAEQFCHFLCQASPASKWIVNSEGVPPSLIIQWNNLGCLHDMIDDFNDPTLEAKLKTALEASGEESQRAKLVELCADQTQQLKRLSEELESRIERRQRTLRKSLNTLDQTKRRLEAFHRALLGIHRASSVLQMEQTLNEALVDSLHISWVRVRFENQSSLKQPSADHILNIELVLAEDNSRAEVLFAKAEGKKFSLTESDFLHELSEALALALIRLHKLEQAETLRAQWQATFDSIPHALVLTSNRFEILKLNRAFQQACAPRTFRSLIGKNCFQTFFGRDFHPPYNMTSPFSFRNARRGSHETEHYEVIGETLGIAIDNQEIELILLRSITEEVRFERRLLEASKLAELGTIGSSIAHELNNPLGGMLSFLQLILIDLKKDDPFYPEIKQMEAAVFRCRDIILNLLGFARKQDLGQFDLISLSSVINRAIKLIELQSKSKGIAIEFDDKQDQQVEGSVNALSTALNNVLQNSIDSLSDKLKLDPLYPAKIKIVCTTEVGRHQIHIVDNGTGIAPEIQTRIFNPLFTTRDPSHHSGMGLTTAYTIIAEHRGTLEVLSQTGSGTTAIISLAVVKKAR